MMRPLPERFRVAFSLAGEQRELVRAVAEEVERRLGESTVFYDEWYEPYIAGFDADVKIQRIYHQQCELAVLCVSNAYGDRPWTLAEYYAIRARYMGARSELDRDRVLAVRVGEGDVEGIYLNCVTPDLRQRSVDESAQLIIDRLQLVSPSSFEPQNARSDWPLRLPVFRWPLADHTEAQAAFCDLLIRASRTRFLPIQGASETGKSSLARQMERNVAEFLPDLRCGRFDFKGSIDRRIETDAFAQSLGLSVSDGRGEGNQLSSALGQLLHLPKPKPTVLIFDTYEDAGNAAMWVERVFLPELLRARWLRVVVLGRQVPSVHEGVWEVISASQISLEPPDAEAWFDYGRRIRPDADIDLDFVVRAHRLAQGKPTTLASLLGP